MRRMKFLLVAVSFLGSLAGCHLMEHSHGVCDCDMDNHCADRSPWIRYAPPGAKPSEAIPTPPTKLPETKKDL